MGWACSVDVTEAGNDCGNLVGNPDTFTIGFDECVEVSTNDSAFSADAPDLNLDAASCSPDAESSVSPASFQTRVAACEPQAAAAECADGTCLDALDEAFDEVCIFADGHNACPAGPYSEQVVVFTELNDTRACSECSCDAPQGSCTGQVRYQTGCSGFLSVSGSHTPPGCVNTSADPGAIQFLADASVSCDPQGGRASGRRVTAGGDHAVLPGAVGR